MTWQPIETAPWDKFVLLCVDSGYKTPDKDFVQCIRHSNAYKNGSWVTAQKVCIPYAYVDFNPA